MNELEYIKLRQIAVVCGKDTMRWEINLEAQDHCKASIVFPQLVRGQEVYLLNGDMLLIMFELV